MHKDVDGTSPVTSGLANFTTGLEWRDMPDDVRNASRDHFVDTLGVIIGGMPSDVVKSVAGVLGLARSTGGIAVPGTRLTAKVTDFAMLCGTAAHGLELDGGYREGTVHPGVAVIPALLALAGQRKVTGRDFLCAVAAGYEVICALTQAAHPALRNRGFHPTSAGGPMGAASAAARLWQLDATTTETALGIAASSCGGLFAFLAGGGDVKRLHGGFGARGGLEAMLFAEAGIDAPHGIVELPSGWAQAFADGPIAISLPPEREFRILDCYFKPHACCRHLQPAFEATVELMRRRELLPQDILAIEVETYGISAAHAGVGWDSFATAQLSFPYLIALAVNCGRAGLENFNDAHRAAPWVAETAAKLSVREAPDLDARYPAERPARVTLRTTAGTVSLERAEALGSREFPLGTTELRNKFSGLVEPVLGTERTTRLLDHVWNIADSDDAGACLALAAQT